MGRIPLEYETQWYGYELVLADIFFPSSGTCYSWGHMIDMPLSLLSFDCWKCGLSISDL